MHPVRGGNFREGPPLDIQLTVGPMVMVQVARIGLWWILKCCWNLMVGGAKWLRPQVLCLLLNHWVSLRTKGTKVKGTSTLFLNFYLEMLGVRSRCLHGQIARYSSALLYWPIHLFKMDLQSRVWKCCIFWTTTHRIHRLAMLGGGFWVL